MKVTQTTKRMMQVLAVALTAIAPASAQITPGFEPSIAPAVHVSWPTTTNRAYQVLVSTNIPGNWTPTGQLLEGTGGRVGSFFTATNGQRFFRIQETTASGLSWLDGTWAGEACQTPVLLSFTVLLQADATNRVFTIRYDGPSTCTSVLSLLSYSDTQARFYESIQSGVCLDDIVLFTRIDETNMAYHFVSTNPPGTGGGLLIKQ